MAKDSTAKIIFKGEDQISPAIKGATASVAGLSTSFDAVHSEAKQTADSIRDNLVKQIELASQKIKEFAAQGLKAEQGQALAEFNKLNNELKRLDSSAAQASNAFASIGGAAGKSAVQIKAELNKAIASVNAELAKLSTQKITPEIQVKQQALVSQLGKLKADLREVDKIVVQPKVQLDPLQLNAISQSFSEIAGKLTELRTAAVGAFTEIAKAERKLSTVSNESKELIKNFGDLAAANKFQTTTAELANASYEVLSAGFTKTADVTKILDASTKGAVGGFSDVTTVSKATISALNAYGQGADQAASFVSKFVSVQQSGLITVDQYASQIARIAPTAAAAGLGIDELNGAIATATASGVPVESTFAGLRTAIGAILKPSSEAVTLAKKLGVNFNATGLKILGLSGILEELKTTGNDSADTLLKLFGSTEALAAIAPSINSIEKLKANIDASKNSAELLGQNFEKAIDPIKALQNEATEALAILGRDILKVFNPILQGTKAVVAAFRALPEPLQQVIAFVVGGGVAIATTGAAISGFLAVLQPTIAGIGLLIASTTVALNGFSLSQVGLGIATTATTGSIGAQGAATASLAGTTATATIATTGFSASIAGLGKAVLAALATVNAVGLGVSISIGSISTLLSGLAVTAGKVAIGASLAIGKIIIALAPLAIKLGLILLAFDAIKNTANLFGAISSNEAEKAFDKILFKTDEVKKKLIETGKSAESFTDKLAGGFDKAESPIQAAALAITNVINALIGAESGASKFGSSFGLISQQQLEAQKTAIAYGNAVTTLNGGWSGALNIASKYGNAIEFQKNVLSLSSDEQKEYRKQLEATTANLKEEIGQLQQIGKQKGVDQENNNREIKARETLLKQSEAKIAILNDETNKTKALADSQKQLVKDLETLAKERAKDAENRKREDALRQRGREFEKKANAEKDTFEGKSKADKRVFEAQLNTEKKAFEDAQKADKKAFEDSLKADTKRFTDGQKAEQKTFDAGQKALDKTYEKEKQTAQRAFDKAQQDQKAAFDKAQQAAALAFDKSQNDAKKTADDQFAQRRLEIERKLQLDAAKTPEDKAKLEAEFKATDEKIAKEKEAFAQLKADELAFAEKQKADKLAFDEAQKAAQRAEEEKQKAAKQAFDDAQKARDDQRELDKQIKKDAFETQLNAKREAFETALNLKKEAFDVAQAAKKQVLDDEQNTKKVAFEDAERAKKEAFDNAQNEKKAAFEDGERAKKQAFEDSLKIKEAQFRAAERAKDITGAQQVATIKAGSGVPVVEAKPLATGGSFRAGEQLLVGERGAELVKFGTSGTVTNAATTKQILGSSNSAPSSVSTARMEALLGQLVGKLDRPNIAVQTSENPSDVVVKVQREIARAAAVRSGI